MNTHLIVIDDPDQPGVMCNFQPYSFSLGGRRSFGGLPNLPNFSLGPVSGSVCDSLSSTGIPETGKDKSKIFIYPQPSSGLISISFSRPIRDQVMCQVTDQLGVKRFQTSILPESGSVSLDVSRLTTGLYHLQVTKSDGSMMHHKLLMAQ